METTVVSNSSFHLCSLHFSRGGPGSSAKSLLGSLALTGWRGWRYSSDFNPIWEFPKTRGTILGVPIIRIIVYWGLYWGPPILGNYQILPQERSSSALEKLFDAPPVLAIS